MTDSWQSLLYDGLLEPKKGKAPPVYSGMITKPNTQFQLSEIVDNSPNIISNNSHLSNLTTKKKYKTSVHRSTAFLPQE